MLFFQQRVRRDVFECQAIFSEAVALLVWIDPIARRGQRETAFDQSGDEHGAKPQAAQVSRFEYAQTVSIRRAKDLRLRTERAAHFLEKRREPRGRRRLCGELDALDRGQEGAAQTFER